MVYVQTVTYTHNYIIFIVYICIEIFTSHQMNSLPKKTTNFPLNQTFEHFVLEILIELI